MTIEQGIQKLSILQKKSHALRHASGMLFMMELPQHLRDPLQDEVKP